MLLGKTTRTPTNLLLILVLAFLALDVGTAAPQDQQPADDPESHRDNSVYGELVDSGIKLSTEVTVKFPRPMLDDETDRNTQLTRIAQLSKRPAEEFILNSGNHPAIVIKPISTRHNTQLGTELHFYFVAQGTTTVIANHNLLASLVRFNAPNRALPKEARALSPQEHHSRNLKEVTRPGYESWYYGFSVPVLNTVQLSGVGFAVRTRSDRSILAAINYLAEFRDDPDFPSVWRQILTKGVAKLSDQKNAYDGLGGYLKATQLHDPRDLVFVECHLVFSQPHEWFGGKDPLRGKLSAAINENVRKFSQELKRATRNNAQKMAP